MKEKLKKMFQYIWHLYNHYKGNTTLTIILWITVTQVFFMDLILNKIPAENEFVYYLGKISYSLCLTYITSYVFLYITVSFPQKKKKLSLHKYLNNKVVTIDTMIMSLISTVYNYSRSDKVSNVREIDYDRLNHQCLSINPNNSITYNSPFIGGNYQSWLYLINSLKTHIKENVNVLIEFQDLLSIEIIEYLADIDDIFDQILTMDPEISIGNTTIEFQYYLLVRLHEYVLALNKEFRSDNIHVTHLYNRRFVRKKSSK